MKISFNLIFLLVPQVFSAVVREVEPRILNTVTSIVTKTAAGPTTITQSTRLVCATLVSPVATTACRRKRQYWSAPIYIQLGQQENDFQPSQVLRVEPSSLPEFRKRPSPASRPFAEQYPISPFALHPSFGDNSVQVSPLSFRSGFQERFFRPFGFFAFQSIFSNIISSLFTSAVTITSTTTVFTTTVTSTAFTATVKYTLSAAPCIPSGVVLCPASATTTTSTTPSTTTTTETTTSATSTAAPTTPTAAPTTTTAGTTTTTAAPTTPTAATTTTTAVPTTTTVAPTTTPAGRKKREADDSSPFKRNDPFQTYIKSLSIAIV